MLAITATTASIWTAIGTGALALATFVSLFFARRALNKTQAQIELGQSQLKQTQEDIALSRNEVEEAHRPVIIPVDRTTRMDFGTATLEAIPQILNDGRLIVPIENIGSGPALNLACSIQLLGVEPAPAPTVQARLAGLGVGQLQCFVVGSYGVQVVLDLALTVEYDDVAGKSWKTSSRYVNKRYEDVAISAQ
jgi:hypothetical protein